MKRPKWYRRLLYGLFVIARILLPLLPLWVIRQLGQGLGTLACVCLRRERARTWEHLEQAFGQHHGAAERRRIASRVFQHLGMNGLEWLASPKFTAAMLQRLIRVHGMEHVQQAITDGKGLIFLSAHFGNWELLAAYFGSLGLRGGVVARRLRYPEYEDWLIAMRRAHGVETFLRDASFKELVRRLKAGECIGLMPDQDVDSIDGIFVDFFGRPAYTPTGPAALALLTGAALLPSYIVRGAHGRCDIYVEPPVVVRSTGDRDRDVREITQGWSRITERYIRTYPDQWVWMHRRWKTSPPVDSTPMVEHA